MLRALIRLCLPLLAASCQRDDTIVPGEPDLVDPPSSLDFGEIQVGRTATLTLRLANEGLGDMTLAATLEPAGEIRIDSAPSLVPGHGTAEIVLAYEPAAEGIDVATLHLATDDPENDALGLPVAGLGVIPRLEISPSTLWFGDIEPGGTAHRSALLSSTGTGRLTVENLVFPGDEATAWAWSLPAGALLPLVLEPGHAVALDLDYLAPAEPFPGEIDVLSDDPSSPGVLRLLAGEGEPQPPRVDILAPAWGAAFLDSEAIEVTIQAVDPDDSPDDLSVLLYLDGHLAGSSVPDPDGRTAFALGALEAGSHAILAQAVDPSGGVGTDQVSVDVQSAEEPLRYVISGGDSVYSYWSVDDDVLVEVDGATSFLDDSGHQSTWPPIEVEAVRGSKLRIAATDVNPSRKLLSGLVLHFGTARSQVLTEAVSASSNPSDPDYDSSYAGPWPSVFLDEEIVVEIP
jgi:hypothetical protein